MVDDDYHPLSSKPNVVERTPPPSVVPQRGHFCAQFTINDLFNFCYFRAYKNDTPNLAVSKKWKKYCNKKFLDVQLQEGRYHCNLIANVIIIINNESFFHSTN